MVNIVVEGPDKAGKGHIIAAIAHALQQLGCVVQVQGAETHNAEKLHKNDEELTSRLKGMTIRITEMQTGI